MRTTTEVRRGTIRLARRLRAERPAGALSTNKVIVLAYLDRHGPSTPGAIAAAERQRPQSLTRTLAELTAAALISRRRSADDGRVSVLALTDAGHDALERDMAARDAWLHGALATLTESEVALLDIAARLLDRLAEADG